jgi:hypothetical protein
MNDSAPANTPVPHKTTIIVARGLPRMSAEQMAGDWSDDQSFERMSGIMPNNRNFGVLITACSARLIVVEKAQTPRSPVSDADLCDVEVSFVATGPKDNVERWLAAVNAQLTEAPDTLRPYGSPVRGRPA